MQHRTFTRRLGTEINVGDRVNVLISDISLIVFASCSEASSRTGDLDSLTRDYWLMFYNCNDEKIARDQLISITSNQTRQSNVIKIIISDGGYIAGTNVNNDAIVGGIIGAIILIPIIFFLRWCKRKKNAVGSSLNIIEHNLWKDSFTPSYILFSGISWWRCEIHVKLSH